MRPNRVKRLLKEGKATIGSWLDIPSISTAEIMAHAGWDWLVVDTEHGPIDVETMHNMFIAISTTDTVPLCRVHENEPTAIKRVLDAGAYGVIVPMVNTPEEAEKAVKACRFPTLGNRAVGPGRWRLYGGADYRKGADDEIMCMIQIEHIDAVNRVEEILSVPGIDGVQMGPGDLSWTMGLGKGLGEQDPAVEEAVARVVAAGKKLGIPIGTAARSVDEAPKRLEQGFRFISVLSDVNYLFDNAASAAKIVKEKGKALGVLE